MVISIKNKHGHFQLPCCFLICHGCSLACCMQTCMHKCITCVTTHNRFALAGLRFLPNNVCSLLQARFDNGSKNDPTLIFSVSSMLHTSSAQIAGPHQLRLVATSRLTESSACILMSQMHSGCGSFPRCRYRRTNTSGGH